MSSRIGDPSDPFENEGLASPDPQDDLPVPGERPVGVDEFGTTVAEQQQGEPLDRRLSREEPELSAQSMPDTSVDADNPYPADREERVGRIVETDEGAREDTESEAVAIDVGTDSGGFTAEEHAMRIEPGR